ncbi:MAG: 4-alpha-glucanotransferase [Clostridia bacterium]|nr:4-alpha-glucanotransferase [Clostridia bacterium]
MEKAILNRRQAGILMPVFSLPSRGGIGVLGKPVYDFIDFLARAILKIWQVLPLTPTGYGDSPYQSCAADAFNYYLIDLEALEKDGLLNLSPADYKALSDGDLRVNYGKMFNGKIPILKRAFEKFDCGGKDFAEFVNSGRYTDFCVFMALKEKFSFRPWNEWPELYRAYDKNITEEFSRNNKREILFWQFTQYIFVCQWQKVRQYALNKGIFILGDVPLYLSYDSVEMWKYGDKLFKVDKDKIPAVFSGAPPDCFSEDGQLWGNPVYDWDKMKEDGYSWWNKRLKDAFALYDIVRLDHFRGFDRYYAVPYSDSTAKNGEWQKGPSFDFFKDKLNLAIVAEDLGVLDEGVYDLMRKTGYAGMRELEYAFDGRKDNEHRPSNYTKNLVCYTGTHDNMPLKGYIDEEFKDEDKKKVFIKALKEECLPYKIEADISSNEGLSWTICELSYASEANTVIIPLCDMLGLGEEARINFSGVQSENNWSWRAKEEYFSPRLCEKLAFLANKYNR